MTRRSDGLAQVYQLRGTVDRPLRRRRRVTVMCVPCGRKFRYEYPGCGPYRSICPKCKGE